MKTITKIKMKRENLIKILTKWIRYINDTKMTLNKARPISEENECYLPDFFFKVEKSNLMP